MSSACPAAMRPALNTLKSLAARGLPALLRVRMQCAGYPETDLLAAFAAADATADPAVKSAIWRALGAEMRTDVLDRTLALAIDRAVAYGLPLPLVERLCQGAHPEPAATEALCAGIRHARLEMCAAFASRSAEAPRLLCLACSLGLEAVARAIITASPGTISKINPWASMSEGASGFRPIDFRWIDPGSEFWRTWRLGLRWLHERAAEMGIDPWPRETLEDWCRWLRPEPAAPYLLKWLEPLSRSPPRGDLSTTAHSPPS